MYILSRCMHAPRVPTEPVRRHAHGLANKTAFTALLISCNALKLSSTTSALPRLRLSRLPQRWLLARVLPPYHTTKPLHAASPHLHNWPGIYIYIYMAAVLRQRLSVQASRLNHQSVPPILCHTEQKFTKANIDRAVRWLSIMGLKFHDANQQNTDTDSCELRLHGDFLVAGWAKMTPRCCTHCVLHFHDRKSSKVSPRSWAGTRFCHAARRSAQTSHAL